MADPWTATIEVTLSADSGDDARYQATQVLDYICAGFDGVAGAVIGVGEEETAIVIKTPAAEARQVLVRLPGHINPDTVHVDFRDGHQGIWTPSDFFPGSKEVRHQ
jgi:hypothetical protein